MVGPAPVTSGKRAKTGLGTRCFRVGAVWMCSFAYVLARYQKSRRAGEQKGRRAGEEETEPIAIPNSHMELLTLKLVGLSWFLAPQLSHYLAPTRFAEQQPAPTRIANSLVSIVVLYTVYNGNEITRRGMPRVELVTHGLAIIFGRRGSVDRYKGLLLNTSPAYLQGDHCSRAWM
ncbi:hypothetical protein Z517_09630 [Fonsecaea pedrosoi CBS 271.37]|uniref:Uncharacterized protein n=1 Tax=Fonsecaea pedrosoi CBS 271.37 TaxID=1442368 RepID=A0A0D2GXS4_9EURO|nr:uncharacterized protein Z517_09630 [Fonsecaea pedrosoi CBS 271.37]KIW77184.1 hypothetical protein Z517_09630 [Fonsecaea pedrosoi CBS 271.37]